jgi:Glycosyl transferase family 2
VTTPADPVRPIEVSAVMPCFNEARTVATCIRGALSYFASAGVSGEVVVADNGSTDGSQDLARAAGARVISVSRRGYGAAVMAGVEAARGRIVVMADADDSYDWKAMGPFVERIRGGAELVMGNRFKGGILPGAMKPLHRYIGNPALSLVARIVFGAPVGDFHCGMRAFTKEAYGRMRLRTPGMEFATEMVANSIRAGLRIAEVPTVLRPDGRDRPPHLRSFRDGWRHLRFILSYAPDHLMLAPGAVAFVIGALLLALTAAGPADVGAIHFGIHWLALGSMLVMLGSSLLTFGIIGKLLLRRAQPAAPSRIVDWILRGFRLELGLVVGLVLFLVGLGTELAILARFIAAGGGPSDATVHPAIAGATVLIVGAQIGFASFIVHFVAEEQRDVD